GRVELDGPHGGEPPAAGGARCPAGEPPARPGGPHGSPRLRGAGFGELPRDAVLLVHAPIGRATGGGGGGKGWPPPCRPPGPSPLRRISTCPLRARGPFMRGKASQDVLAGIDPLQANDAEWAMTAELRALGLLWVGEGRPPEAEALLLRAEGRVRDAGLRAELRAVRATVLFFS